MTRIVSSIFVIARTLGRNNGLVPLSHTVLGNVLFGLAFVMFHVNYHMYFVRGIARKEPRRRPCRRQDGSSIELLGSYDRRELRNVPGQGQIDAP